MRLLLDTQLLLWAAGQPKRLSAQAKRELNDPENEPFFSAASLWEVTIKSSLGRDDFHVEPRVLRVLAQPGDDRTDLCGSAEECRR